MQQCRPLTSVVLNQSGVGELCAVSAYSQGHVWFTEDIIISTITVRKHEISISEIYYCCCYGSCLDLQQPCPNTDIYHRHSQCSLSSEVMWQYVEYCCMLSVQSQKKCKRKDQLRDSATYEPHLTIFFLLLKLSSIF